jgi:hypothetical protein
VKKMGKVDGPDVEKPELIKLYFFMNPDNPHFQLLPTLCYLQGWIPGGFSQVVDILP